MQVVEYCIRMPLGNKHNDQDVDPAKEKCHGYWWYVVSCTPQVLGWYINMGGGLGGGGVVRLMHRVFGWCLWMHGSGRNCLLYCSRSTVVGVGQPCGSWDEPPRVLILGWGRTLQRWDVHNQCATFYTLFVCQRQALESLPCATVQKIVWIYICWFVRIGHSITWRAHYQK